MPTNGNQSTAVMASTAPNKDDLSLWRWFCVFYEAGRIRWMRSTHGWLVSVDGKHLSTEQDFDMAIRMARERYFSGKRISFALVAAETR